ncbi:DUF3644 domain-containing protein [Halomonas heilongjiangensis]|uniref:DUF3644 domain-containing protein n=1 Tax=Halomonas heilongjiangensis TaxID=1387883 RepID=A0A2N7TM06_9GAMM|nr:DUF3644 domain-containing protein [Halomonas heilongjiangensis]PMR69225.1 DUF3644 domain-containing protein [Halomonas heilongjiangensis]PXX87417.1 hypothetical protein CR158_18795 [Halomonas heilongjiangensis]
MPGRNRTIGSVKAELITKSRAAALSAVKIFNDPLIKFKSETYIVLMIIAWTYLMHAYYRSQGIEYRYHRKGLKRKTFDKTKKGAYKHWELERCLNCEQSPIDKDTANNLHFLIGLRHEIEHQMTRSLDSYLSGRYQACALNFNDYIKKLFGEKHGLDEHLTYSLQFVQIAQEQIQGGAPQAQIPGNIRAYIAEFDGILDHDDYNSSKYSYRLLFKKKMVNRPGQADSVIEFIKPDSELAKAIDKEYWVKKEVERPKYRPSEVAQLVREAGFPKFRVQPEHVNFWKSEDAKNPGKGYGVEVSGTWFWYESWVERCIKLCEAGGDRYR